jgi:hypothetical protein
MKIKHQEPFIPTEPESNPFENCELDRKQYAEVLTKIVGSYAVGFVMAIDNKWGTGKTTFVKMWRQYLKNNQFETLYFNAWENDFQDEVIIALLSELKELKNQSTKTFNKVLEKTAVFMRKAAPAVIKGAAGKAIGNEAVTTLIEAATSFTTAEVEQEIKNFNNKKKGIIEFRESLEKFVNEVDNEKPVVFIIDELDRCRPNYAVKILEQIKHLFSVPGIVFVLSIDKEQLGNAVRGYYGSDLIEADEYLKRFIDLEYRIPDPNITLFINYLYEYYEFDLFIKHQNRINNSNFKMDKDRLISFSHLIFFNENYTLRQMEKVFIRVRLTLNAFSLNQIIYPDVILLLDHIRRKSPKLYQDIKTTQLKLQDFIDKIEVILNPLNKEVNIRFCQSLLGSMVYRYFLDYRKLYHTSRLELIKYNSELQNHVFLLSSIFEDEHNNLANIIRSHENSMNTSDVSLSWIINKYDLIESFHTIED